LHLNRGAFAPYPKTNEFSYPDHDMNLEASAIRNALLSLAALVTAISSSHAQETPLVPIPEAHDLFVGFRSTELGRNRSYLVRLGNNTTLFNTVSGTGSITLDLGGIGADLTSEFGSDWFSNPNLTWGIFGANYSVNRTVYGSRERSDPSTPALPWPAKDSTPRNVVGNAIISVVDNGYRGSFSTANSLVATFQTNSADAKSYYKQVSGADFGGLTEWSSIEGSFASSASKSLDVFQVGPAGVARVGTFTISSGGTITFSKTGPSNPNADTDGDGRLDADEILAGTSPTDATDFFRVQGTVKTSGNSSLSFKPAANRTYKLEYSPDLTAGSWVEITAAAPAPPATLPRYVTAGSPPSSFAFEDVDPVRTGNAKGFYRIVVSQNAP